MFKKLLLFSILFFSISSFSQVVINELDSDTPSTDDKEFIELKSTVPNFSLDGYILVLFNGTGSQANLSYYVINLNGATTDLNGLFVVGNNLVSPVPGKILPDNIFQNGPDGVGLYFANVSDFPNLTQATTTNLIDALVYGTNDPDATSLMSLLNVTTQWNESAGTGGSTVNSIQRKVDGTYESKPPTPGTNNDGSGFVYNGLRINTTATEYTEGQIFIFTVTTQNNVTTNTNFNISLSNGNFNTSDYTGNLAVSIPAGQNTWTTTITLVDDTLDEGDEVLKIKFGTIPAGFNRLNDNILIRVIDNDFYTEPFGTPLNPTFGNVTSTAPSGYYSSLEGLSGNALKQALQNIIADPNLVHAHNYGDIIDILKVADQNPLNSNQVWLMYVEVPRSKLDFQDTGINTGKWNREHIYPQSRGGYSNGTSSIPDGINVWLPTNANDLQAGHGDAHHIRAEDGPENSSRNNKDYGEYNGPAGTQGSWHGDVARSLFYMAVRYNGLSLVNGNPANTTVGQLGDLALLLQWNVSDPKDDFEMNRNNYIYTWQLNRNPFIDYPNLADYIFGANFGQPWSSTLSNSNFNKDKIVIYPNPTKNTITISGNDTDGNIELYNSVGSLVYKNTFSVETSTFKLNLEAGIYFAKITTENSTISKKIIITN